MERLNIDQKLYQNQAIVSPNRKFTLKQQEDGNLVLYDGAGKAIWHTNTATGKGSRSVLQKDGNFVVYQDGGNPIWSAKSNRDNFGGYLMLTDEGKILIVDQVFDVTKAPAK